MPSQFRYAAHTLLDRRIGRSPTSIFFVGLYGPPKNQRSQKTDFFNGIGEWRPLAKVARDGSPSLADNDAVAIEANGG
jgi:hypothetical protein